MGVFGRQRERGFALPFAILMVTVITLMLLAAFVRAHAEQRLAESSGSTVEALAGARSGLNRFVRYYDSAQIRPADGDSLRFNVTGGYADVIANLVETPADTFDTHRYIVRSRGTVIEPTQGADPQAGRTVAQFANWFQGGINDVAAFISINITDYAFNAGTDVIVDGTDWCGPTTIMGFRAVGTSDTLIGPLGTPPQRVQNMWPTVANETGIDWDAIENGGAITPDYTSVISGDMTYATYLITGDVIFTNVTGTGLLIVTGKVDTQGTIFEWDGVILIGDDFDPHADTTRVRGMVVTGLDETTGGAPAWNGFAAPGENIYIQYASCRVQRALEPFRGFVPISTAWVDNWAEY